MTTSKMKGRIISSELGQVDGYTYGTLTILTPRGRMDVRITRDTVGVVPPDGSFVLIEYQGGHSAIAVSIGSLSVEEYAKTKTQFQREETLSPIKSTLSSLGSIRWPEACASCGAQENLTKYRYVHTSKKYLTTGISRGTVETSLPVRAYLCQKCKVVSDEKNRIPRATAIVAIVLGLMIGLLLPFIPGFLIFIPISPQYRIYLPTIQISILYIIIVGIPSLYCFMVNEKAEHPFLDFIGIHSMGVMHGPPNYKFVFKSPEYKEHFSHLNGFQNIAKDAGLSGLKFDYEMLCAGICCAGAIIPTIAAFIYHIIAG